MAITHSAVVYRRGDRIFVAPEAGPGSVLYQIEPVLEARPETESLAAALEQGLAHSKRTPGQAAPNLREYRPPVLAKAGAKNWSQFARGLAQCSVARGPDGVEIQAWRPIKGGFEPIGEPDHLPATVQMSEVAERVLACLQSAKG